MAQQPDHSQFTLLGERRFLPFFLAQALGAFNDNVYRAVLVLLATYHASEWTTLEPVVVANLAGGVFIAPFLLFSGLAGQLADRYDKARVLQSVKAAEIGIMGVAALGFAMHQLPVLLAALFLLGTHSTFFAPAKYGYLPQVLDERELVGGNALLEAGTFLAILGGTLAGGVLVADGGVDAALWALIAFAVAGFLASLGIPAQVPADPGLRIDPNPWTSTLASLRAGRRSHTVFQSLLGNSWFWFYGAAVVTQLPLLAKNVLGGDESVVTLLLLVFSVGVGLGSLACERLSGHRVEIGLVPLGSIGLTVFGLDFALHAPAVAAGAEVSARALLEQPGAARLLIDLALFGLSGGLFVVPLYALIQSRSKPAERSRVLAANNILNALFMVAAAGFSAFALSRGLSIPQLLIVLALMNAAVALYIYTRVPEFLLRFLAWLLVHPIYRLRFRGVENIPERGAALLICNHVSFVDAIVISAGCRRPIRFIMEHGIFEVPALGWVFRGMKAIPVASQKTQPEVYDRAFQTVARELAAGQLVCIFPEGRLTADGEIAPFRAGMLRILQETPVPVVPMALSGLWGSMFSREQQALWRRLPKRLFGRIVLSVGPPIPPEAASLETLQATVQKLRGLRR